MHDLSRTIVAVASGPGRGGVGCVRISGPDASAIAQRLFAASEGVPGPGSAPRFGNLLDSGGRAIDHGYAVVFARGRSFTGESTVELWPHGSPPVLAALVAAAIAAGADPAEPGEFTYRAVAHGRLDLTRAEAVRELVQARTLYQARLAHAQAEGAVARRIAPLVELLEETIVRLEASIEFADEEETTGAAADLDTRLGRATSLLATLLAEFERGAAVRRGARVAIVGPPNAGKSSLFNALVGHDRAIVTDVPGTTRDTVEAELDIDGLPLWLIDTAGERETVDPVERAGVERTRRARREADLLIELLVPQPPSDPDSGPPSEPPALTAPDAVPTLRVVSKCDLDPVARAAAALAEDVLRVSALEGRGLSSLLAVLRERLIGTGGDDDPLLTVERHGEALRAAAAQIARARAAREQATPDELVLEDIRQARERLATITGEFGNEALYDRVFSTFCLGK